MRFTKRDDIPDELFKKVCDYLVALRDIDDEWTKLNPKSSAFIAGYRCRVAEEKRCLKPTP